MAQNDVFLRTDGLFLGWRVMSFGENIPSKDWIGNFKPKRPKSIKQELGYCWDGRAILHSSNFRCQVWVPLF